MRERVETETKTPEKISHLEERGDDDERRMEQEEAHWWSRGEKEVPLVWQEDPEEPEGPPKTESPKMAKVLEKVEAPKVPRGPLRIEMPVESSKPIDEEKCDTRDFRSKSNKAKEEETEVEPIPVEKTSVAGIKEHPMETKEERVNHEDTKTEEGMRAMEVGEYPEEKETRHSEEEGSWPSWDREESSSDVSSPSTIPMEPMEWPEEEECLEVSSDGNGYWSNSMTESSVTESVDGWLEGEERSSPMGGWRTLSPESDKSHDSNASTREPSPRRSTVLESFCRVFPPVRTNIEVDSEKSEEENPLLREKMMMTEDQGTRNTHGEEEESEVLYCTTEYTDLKWIVISEAKVGTGAGSKFPR